MLLANKTKSYFFVDLLIFGQLSGAAQNWHVFTVATVLVPCNDRIQIIKILIHFFADGYLVPVGILLEGINDLFVEFVSCLVSVVEEGERYHLLLLISRFFLLTDFFFA